MRAPSSFALAAGVLFAAWAAPTDAQTKIPVDGTDRWKIRYADSTVSLNDICPIAKKRLGARKAPVYVNHEPVGFC